jgi:hypothetical protein
MTRSFLSNMQFILSALLPLVYVLLFTSCTPTYPKVSFTLILHELAIQPKEGGVSYTLADQECYMEIYLNGDFDTDCDFDAHVTPVIKVGK